MGEVGPVLSGLCERWSIGIVGDAREQAFFSCCVLLRADVACFFTPAQPLG